MQKNNPNYKHGEASMVDGRSAEYQAWAGMIQRCENPNSAFYSRYGGRGITVCKRWRDSFENFLEDMGRKPTAKHTLERENNSGNYNPTNCKWATRKEQNRNTSFNIKLTLNGETLCIGEWAEKIGKPYTTIWSRYRRGKPVEIILKELVKK